MLGDNIKILRRNKGFTQEELAVKLNVVRQTVSKWEKGLSVPDAEMLQKIADILEVDIKQLLGAEIEMERSNNEIVEQLVKINEQLIIKNRRSKRIWKIVGIILVAVVVLNILLIVLSYSAFENYTISGTEVKIKNEQMIIEDETNYLLKTMMNFLFERSVFIKK